MKEPGTTPAALSRQRLDMTPCFTGVKMGFSRGEGFDSINMTRKGL